MSVISELKRRNVFRVALFYIVSSWLLVQVAETVLPVFGVPDTFIRGIIVVLVMGFVPALVFAWIFELTPDGLRRERPEADAVASARPVSQKLNIATLVIAVLAIGLLAVDRFGGSTSRDGANSGPQAGPAPAQTMDELAPPARSIAVLAFEDLSPEANQAYFAEGVSEELLNLLARIEDFKVAARTSSFKFKGTGADIAEIGRALNVETVLEGSVRKAGDQVRVTAQLINVADGYHLWSNSYDRRLENIFAVQDEIAGAIVEQLRLQFDVEAETASRTTNVEAYDHYLRGRELAREPTRDGLLRAIEQFQAALAIDPDFAAAHAGIANAWVWLEDYGGVKSSEAYPKAEQAARRALALDEESAEAHAAMAFVLDRYYDDKQGASEYFERTLELNPNYVTAYNLYGDVLRDMGLLERMIEVHRRAVELDPLSPFMRMRLAAKLQVAGEPEESRRLIAELLAEQPDNDYAFEELGNLKMGTGDFSGAFDAYRKVHVQRPGDPYSASQMAEMSIVLEDETAARAWIAEARARGEDNRWELDPREQLAKWQQDWESLREVGDLRGGHTGARMRGEAAIGLGHWAEARRHFTEALRMSGYTPDEPVLLQHVHKLAGLEIAERALELSPDPNRLEQARRPLELLVDAKAIAVNDLNYYVALARFAALQGDHEEAIDLILQGFGQGEPIPEWFLLRDPAFETLRDLPAFQAAVDRARDLRESLQASLPPDARMP
ncbi:tetratricopeptide repeat protein [Halomonas denitrificans]|nr:hypothetical protein [Halomonas denitrificans]